MKKGLAGKLILLLSVILSSLFIFTACGEDNSGNGYNGGSYLNDYFGGGSSIDNGGSTGILHFYEKTGVKPDVTKGSIETYNNSVSTAQLDSYAEYLLSCGYTEDTQTENQYRSEYDYLRMLAGTTDKDFVNIAAIGGVATVGYGADCRFASDNNDNHSGGITPIIPDISKVDPVQLDCPVCNGSGKVVCNSCHGTGYFTSTEYAPDYGFGGGATYEKKQRCPRCSGSGQAMCTKCAGTGKVN